MTRIAAIFPAIDHQYGFIRRRPDGMMFGVGLIYLLSDYFFFCLLAETMIIAV